MAVNGAQMLLQCLLEEGVDVIFGYPGGAVLPIYDALYESPIRHVLVRHEQGAVHAADGYARVSGRVGVCLATSGPGATNLVTGLATAHMDSIPIVALTGQVGRGLIGSDAFQEVDICGITRAITKHNYLIEDPAQLPRIVHEAFYLARTGRPGPVLIDVPKDVSLWRGPMPHPPGPPARRGYRVRSEPNPQALDDAAQAIAAAHRPLIIAGGGLIHANATEEFRTFVETAQVPVASTLMGLGALQGLHDLHLGLLGMHGTFCANRATAHADLVVGLGLRFDDRVTGNAHNFAPKARIVHVEIDEAEIGKTVRADIPVVGDLKQALPRLTERLRTVRQRAPAQTYAAWWDDLRAWQERQGWNWSTPMDLGGVDGRPLRPQAVIQQVHRATGGRAVIATDVGQHQMWTALLYPFDAPRRLVTSGGQGTMGYGLPAALGAQMAAPGTPVWLITGDGSIQMNLQEMATAVNYGLPVRVVVINNRSLGMVRQWQELFHQERYCAVDINQLPDYTKLAEAYGWSGFHAETAADLEAALDAAAAAAGPVIIDVLVEQQENVFPMVPSGAALGDVILHKPAQAAAPGPAPASAHAGTRR